MRSRLVDENEDEIPRLERLVGAIEDFYMKTGLLLAACMIPKKYGPILNKKF